MASMTVAHRMHDTDSDTVEATLAALRRQNLGVDWFLPGERRRFATTTKATSDLIALFGEQGMTFGQARREVRYDQEAEAVLEWFCRHGYAAELVHDYVR